MGGGRGEGEACRDVEGGVEGDGQCDVKDDVGVLDKQREVQLSLRLFATVATQHIEQKTNAGGQRGSEDSVTKDKALLHNTKELLFGQVTINPLLVT